MVNNEIKAGVSTVIAVTSFFMGGTDNLLRLFLVFLATDYILGIFIAVRDEVISSKIGTKGIFRKIGKLILIGVAYLIEFLTGGAAPLRDMMIAFLLLNEIISVIENLIILDVPFPKTFANIFIQARKKLDQEKCDTKKLLIKEETTITIEESEGIENE